MAIRTLGKASSKAQSTSTPKEKLPVSKVQASSKAPPVLPVMGAIYTFDDSALHVSKLFKVEGQPFDESDDEYKKTVALAHEFYFETGYLCRTVDELMAWADSPTLKGKKVKSRAPGTHYGNYLRKFPLVEKASRTRECQVTTPGPRLDISTAKKMRQPAEGMSTTKDRTEKVAISPVCPDGLARMASKKESTRKGKGKYGLTLKDAQAALKTAPNTPAAKGYSAEITAMSKFMFSVTVSALKADEINKLVEAARENGLIG